MNQGASWRTSIQAGQPSEQPVAGQSAEPTKLSLDVLSVRWASTVTDLLDTFVAGFACFARHFLASTPATNIPAEQKLTESSIIVELFLGAPCIFLSCWCFPCKNPGNTRKSE